MLIRAPGDAPGDVPQQDELPLGGDPETGWHRRKLGVDRDGSQAVQQRRGQARTACAAQGGQNSIFTYGGSWPASFPANPLRDDPSAGNAEQMELEHYQTAFEPLLYGVVIALVLILILKETGPAARSAASTIGSTT